MPHSPWTYKQKEHLLLLFTQSIDESETRGVLRAFAKEYRAFREEECALLAITPDTVFANLQIQENLGLPFPLLADPQGEVVIVAPDRERSAVSHSLTLHRPLRVEELGAGRYAVNGTPTDCVNLAINGILPRRPTLVVSGINKGANLGDDVTYSGTVSAAMEGTLLGVPSLAISLLGRGEFRFDAAARFSRRLATWVVERGLSLSPPG